MKYSELRTPSYIVQEGALKHNLEILKNVREKTGCKILLAQKAFSMYRVYPLIASYLDGTTASGIYEARLSHEEFGGDVPENHVFEPAYDPSEMKELCEMCTHIYFNSISQLELHRPVWEPYRKAGKIKVALRINPEFSTQEGHEIYDPCSSGSRLGIRRCDLPDKLPEGVTGLHFHTLCEQNVQPLIDTFYHIEEKFAEQLKQISWINMGGGHHITRDDYETKRLMDFLNDVKDRYGFQIYLEPGEAIALNAGTLITRVMDIVNSDDIPTLILDASAACHMPDVLEMPYTPPLFGALESRPGTEPFRPCDALMNADNSDTLLKDAVNTGTVQNAGDDVVLSEESSVTEGNGSGKNDTNVTNIAKVKDNANGADITNSPDITSSVWVRLASRTCLAGDVIGIYRLSEMPAACDILTFGDMAIYSMVKNNTFNGMPLPDIVLEKDSEEDDRYEIVKRFGYEDFKGRL